MSVKLVEWFDDHWYKVEDEKETHYFPSVTTKLGIVAKPFLAKWRGDIGNREADMRVFEARERGTRIHHAWYILTGGGAVVFNPSRRQNFTEDELKKIALDHNGLIEIVKYQDEMVQIWKLKQFLDILKPEIVACETIVYSDKYREAGTIDNVFKVKEGEYLINGKKPLYLKGGIYVADLKTGNSFDDNAYLQMAAYASMWTERTGMTVVGTFGIHTGSKLKTGISGLGINSRTFEQMQIDWEDYRHVSAIWERKHSEDRPETFEFPSFISLKQEKINAKQ